MDRQREIIRMATHNGGVISRQEIVHALGRTYYHNGAKHLQAVIGRMINNGILIRTGKGIYKLTTGRKGLKPNQSHDPDQGSLFKEQ